jgi:hypothetical protein
LNQRRPGPHHPPSPTSSPTYCQQQLHPYDPHHIVSHIINSSIPIPHTFYCRI